MADYVSWASSESSRRTMQANRSREAEPHALSVDGGLLKFCEHAPLPRATTETTSALASPTPEARSASNVYGSLVIGTRER